METVNDQNRSKQYDKYEDGPEGVDKAPGEEPAKSDEDLTKESQKGKKVDADLSNEADQPLKP